MAKKEQSEKYKGFLSSLRNQFKKGSKYVVEKTGEVKKTTDFKRGEAMGRYKQICESATYHANKKKKLKETEEKDYYRVANECANFSGKIVGWSEKKIEEMTLQFVEEMKKDKKNEEPMKTLV